MYTLNTDPAQIMKKRAKVAKAVTATASPLTKRQEKMTQLNAYSVALQSVCFVKEIYNNTHEDQSVFMLTLYVERQHTLH